VQGFLQYQDVAISQSALRAVLCAADPDYLGENGYAQHSLVLFYFMVDAKDTVDLIQFFRLTSLCALTG
jgi:hypothetical protein